MSYSLIVYVVLIGGLLGGSAKGQDDPYQHAVELLSKYPLIDGHDDLAEWLRGAVKNHLSQVNLSGHVDGAQADIPRLLKGKVGGQFWSAFMGCSTQYHDSTRTFIDQIDVIKRFVAQYPIFQFATSADEVESAFNSGHIASMIGIEGGHVIDSSLGTLRQLYDLGARYMTLTHMCDTPWADTCSIPGPPRHGGLNDFGKRVVREMNRLGMLVDISHVSATTMRVVLNTTAAPVIFSHSSAFALCNNSRNVPDDVLQQMPANGGVVMVNFYPPYVNCSPNATLSQVADHIDYIKKVAGVEHVGIGSDFNGVDYVPVGLEDVSKYPYLFAELITRGYSDDELIAIAGGNILRVFHKVEAVRDSMKDVLPDDTLIDPQPNEPCRPDF